MAKHMSGKHYRSDKPEKAPRRTQPETPHIPQEEQETEEAAASRLRREPVSYEPDEEAAGTRTRAAERAPQKRRRSPVIPIVIFLLVAAIGIIVYILWSLGLFGGAGLLSSASNAAPTPGISATTEPTPTAEPTPTPTPSPTPVPTPPPIYDDGTEGYMSSGICIYNNQGFEMFYGSDDMAVAYAEMINTFADRLPGIQVYNMVVPNHSEFGLPERVRDYYGESSQRQNTSTIYENLSGSVKAVDVYDVLNLHNDENIYLGTDTHWAPLGAYYAYTKFCEVAQCETASLDDYDKTTYSFTGYLAYATGEDVLYNNPDTLDIYDPTFDYTCEMSYDGLSFYETDTVNTHDESMGYSMYLSGDMGCVRVTNNTLSTGRKLLIIKDSYGNAIAPFLMASFDEVHVVDFRYFSDNLPDYCAAQGITDVLFFNNEMSANTSVQHDSMWSLFD